MKKTLTLTKKPQKTLTITKKPKKTLTLKKSPIVKKPKRKYA